jgi:dihydrofolate reductase
MRCSVFVAISLDGFLARLDGSIDWLEKYQLQLPAGEDAGFSAFLDTVDGLLMGRKTFEQIRDFRPWPYQNKSIFVLASRPFEIPADLDACVHPVSGPLATCLATLAGQGYAHLYVDGGTVIRSCLTAKLIDELTLTIIPVVLGTGLPLFMAGPETDLRLCQSRVIPPGLVQSTWEVMRHGA